MTPAEKTRMLAERVMGWHYWDSAGDYDGPTPMFAQAGEEVWFYGTEDDPISNWSPLTNLSHAGEVMEAMAKKGWSARITTNACAASQNGCEFFRAYLGLGRDLFNSNYAKYSPHNRVAAVAETVPTAICHAALLAHEVKEEEL